MDHLLVVYVVMHMIFTNANQCSGTCLTCAHRPASIHLKPIVITALFAISDISNQPRQLSYSTLRSLVCRLESATHAAMQSCSLCMWMQHPCLRLNSKATPTGTGKASCQGKYICPSEHSQICCASPPPRIHIKDSQYPT